MRKLLNFLVKNYNLRTSSFFFESTKLLPPAFFFQTKSFFLFSPGFDDYYKSLVPRMGKECEGNHERNPPHKTMAGKFVNCRNVWFREFWSQHHKCTFSNNNAAAGSSGDDGGGVDTHHQKQCTGTEELVDYKQEGLVPFVGWKLYLHYRDKKKACLSAVRKVVPEVFTKLS